MKVNLTIADRFAILEVLPSKGNFATLKIVRELREQLSLTQAEIKEQKVVESDGQITWANGAWARAMDFGDFDTEMIQKALKSLNDSAKLEERHYSIYEQFVEAK